MNLQFDDNLVYQKEAIDSVLNIFKGQPERTQTNFTVYSPSTLESIENDLGYSNKVVLPENSLWENIRQIQLNNGLALSKRDEVTKPLDLTVEMETGTGKTYVYLRTIMELYVRYGFAKHIIVVPSIAIKEGTYKNLQITQEHFNRLYDNTPYRFFTYDSKRLTEVRDFATNCTLEIMVINIDSFSRDIKENNNIIHQYRENLSYKPIELIQQTKPIIFVDEPQSAMSTQLQKESVRKLGPSVIIRYSATHREKINLVYRLSAIDAHKKQLVKKISVGSIKSFYNYNDAYIRLTKVILGKGKPTAEVEVDVFSDPLKGVNKKGNIKRKKIKIKQGDDLEERTGREEYKGYVIKDICGEKGNEHIDFLSSEQKVYLQDTINDRDREEIKKKLIELTIEKHLDKELELFKNIKTKNELKEKGIKVLSLFFIDQVSRYKQYDQEGKESNGIYAQWFEEQYHELIQGEKYNKLRCFFHGGDNKYTNRASFQEDIREVHNGYFSEDKRPKKSNQKETYKYYVTSSGKSKKDRDTYNLIMKKKEELLSFNSKLRFIFSHSALKEGWDNPNVFQICTLRDMGKSLITPRQQIGRGLRLCVNQKGERIHDQHINRLLVMITESYAEFVRQLQKDTVRETGITFGLIKDNTFRDVTINTNDENNTLGDEKSKAFCTYLKSQDYLDESGKTQPSLKKALDEDKLYIPEDIVPPMAHKRITNILQEYTSGIDIKDESTKSPVKVNNRILNGPAFKELWDKVKHKTTYSVKFDSEKLKKQCIDQMNKELSVKTPQLKFEVRDNEVTERGYKETYIQNRHYTSDTKAEFIPDILGKLVESTQLTRRTIGEILTKCDKLNQVKKNPQDFIRQATHIINRVKTQSMVDGLRYKKIESPISREETYYCEELFQEQYTYIQQCLDDDKPKKESSDDRVQPSEKSPYQKILCDSQSEVNFSKELEQCDLVKVYAKLPDEFQIKTPLGTYNPDWIINFHEDKTLYFVVETKGTNNKNQLRVVEQQKLDCEKKHFDAFKDKKLRFRWGKTWEGSSGVQPWVPKKP
ncbi:MAG: DEAD/DEAH box helicase family protein [Flavobacteriaceae bacterium]|nr:DEAD/DEAH box helicase family protein [Flavobacteriaceae bacterium]